MTKIRLHFLSSVSPGYSTLCAGTCSRHQSSINSSSWIELSTCKRIEFHVLIYNDLTRHRAKTVRIDCFEWRK